MMSYKCCSTCSIWLFELGISLLYLNPHLLIQSCQVRHFDHQFNDLHLQSLDLNRLTFGRRFFFFKIALSRRNCKVSHINVDHAKTPQNCELITDASFLMHCLGPVCRIATVYILSFIEHSPNYLIIWKTKLSNSSSIHFGVLTKVD